jgi:hypothetical protein
LYLPLLFFENKQITKLSGSNGSIGFAMPNIILGAFIYCMLRPQFSKIFTNENQLFYVGAFPKSGAINSL